MLKYSFLRVGIQVGFPFKFNAIFNKHANPFHSRILYTRLQWMEYIWTAILLADIDFTGLHVTSQISITGEPNQEKRRFTESILSSMETRSEDELKFFLK